MVQWVPEQGTKLCGGRSGVRLPREDGNLLAEENIPGRQTGAGGGAGQCFLGTFGDRPFIHNYNNSGRSYHFTCIVIPTGL